MTPALRGRLSGHPLLILLDLDGTLSPIVPRPEYAIVPHASQRVLRELAALPGAHVAIITGRAVEDARRLVCVDDVWIIGNHGLEIAPPNRPATPRDDVARFADRIAAAALRCQDIADREPGVIVEDKRWTLSVHYRLVHPHIVPRLSAAVTQIASDLGLRVTHGKEVLELRPFIEVDKGTAAVDLASTLHALQSGASLLCAGDDRTDEDAFRALRAAQPACVTVRVGADTSDSATAAEFWVLDTEAMRELLEEVLALHRAG